MKWSGVPSGVRKSEMLRHPHDAPVTVQISLLDLAPLEIAGEHSLVADATLRQVVGMGQLLKGQRKHLLGRITEQLTEGLVDLQEPSVGCQKGDPDRRRLECAAEMLLAPGRGEQRPAELDLGQGGGCNVLEQLGVALAPGARFRVDRAEAAEHMTVSVDERDAEVRDHADVLDCRVVAYQRLNARVLDDERLAGGYDVLAEGMRQRRLALRCPRLGETEAALEELTVALDQRDECDRRPEQARSEPC